MSPLDAAVARLHKRIATLQQEKEELRAERDYTAGRLEYWRSLHLDDDEMREIAAEQDQALRDEQCEARSFERDNDPRNRK